MRRLTRDGTAEPVSRDQILRRERGQGNINLPCSADYEQDWQPYPADPYPAICDNHTYMELTEYGTAPHVEGGNTEDKMYTNRQGLEKIEMSDRARCRSTNHGHLSLLSKLALCSARPDR